MFSKKDYENYFIQIRDIESVMLKDVLELMDYISDKELVPILEEIKQDEIKHREMVNKILELIK